MEMYILYNYIQRHKYKQLYTQQKQTQINKKPAQIKYELTHFGDGETFFDLPVMAFFTFARECLTFDPTPDSIL